MPAAFATMREHRVLTDNEEELDQGRRFERLGEDGPRLVGDVGRRVQLVGRAEERTLQGRPRVVIGQRLGDGRDLGVGEVGGAGVLHVLDPFERALAVPRDAQREELVVPLLRTPFSASAAAQVRNGASRSGCRASTAMVRAGSRPGCAISGRSSATSGRSSSAVGIGILGVMVTR